MTKARNYTQEQYDNATSRISRLININQINNIQELDRELKKQGVYHDVKGGLGTIYDQLLTNWREHVKPDKIIEQETIILKKKRKPRLSHNKIRKQRRTINRLNGISHYREENKIKIRKVKGEVRQYILHKGRYHKLENIIVYNRTIVKKNEVSQKWYTRRKPLAKSVRKQLKT